MNYSETIFRVEKDANNPFVMIDKRVFENEKLSYKAKGILGYLLSRPNDWVVMAVDIKNRSTDGKDSVASGIQELIEHGYIVKTEQPRQAGKFATCDYVVYECPINTESNRSGKTVTDKPQRINRNGKTATTNTDYTNKDNTNTEKDNIKAEKQKTAAAAKKPKPTNAKLEKPTGVTEQTWADLLQIRKVKGKPLTVTAWNYNYPELQKGLDAGVSLENMLVTWAAKGWQGFKFEWYLNEQKGGNYGNANNQPVNQNITPTAQQWEDANWAAFEQYYSSSSQ